MRNFRSYRSNLIPASVITLSVCATMILLGPGPLWAKHHTAAATTPTPTPTPKPTPTPVPSYQVQSNLFFLSDEVKAAKAPTVTYDALKKDKDGTSYHVHFLKKTTPADQVYYLVHRDWCESITGVDRDPSKGIADNETQIREPQGDVEVALPADLTKFVPATDMMVIPDGALIKTADGATAGILFGSVASARLIPNSIASVTHQVAETNSTIVVDLKSGGAFSKVASYGGISVSFQVKTQMGSISGSTGGKVLHPSGLDFAVYSASDRTDLYVLKGPLEMDDATGAKVGIVENKDKLALVGKHLPAIADPATSLSATGQSLGALMGAIPIINVKSKAILAKEMKHGRITTNEETFVKNIKRVPVYERLDAIPISTGNSQPMTTAPTATQTPQQISPPADATPPTPTPMETPVPTATPNLETTPAPAVTPSPTSSTLTPFDPPTLPPKVSPTPDTTGTSSTALPPSLHLTPPSPTVPLPSATPAPNP